jgi:hypothetical protein
LFIILKRNSLNLIIAQVDPAAAAAAPKPPRITIKLPGLAPGSASPLKLSIPLEPSAIAARASSSPAKALPSAKRLFCVRFYLTNRTKMDPHILLLPERSEQS